MSKNGDVELQQVPSTSTSKHHRLEHDITNCGKTYVTPSRNGNFCFSVALIAAASSLVIGNVIVIPAIEITIGAIYLRDCPHSSMVPASLIFIGLARLLYHAASTYVSHKRTGVAEDEVQCCTCPNILLGLLYIVFFVAVIVGAVATFSLVSTIHKHQTPSYFDDNPKSNFHCNATAFRCAAVLVAVELILLALGWIIYICRRCFIRCSQSN